MASFAERQDQFVKASGFQVNIQGAASDGPDGTWKVCRGGGIRFDENQGTTTGNDHFKQHSHGLREWENITLVGPVTKTRKDMLKWYQNTVKGEDHRRNISIILLGQDGQEIYRYDYNDCFLLHYRLTELDAESDNVCEEEVQICPGYSPNYLK